MFLFFVLSCFLCQALVAEGNERIEGYRYRNGDCTDNDIRKITMTTIARCASECDALENCKSFIFNSRGNYCWLKSSECPRLTDTYVRNYHFYTKTVHGLPVFIQEPEDSYYIVKNKPVTVICKAAPAIQINFKCASEWMRPDHVVTMEHTDPKTNVKYLQASVDISLRDVDEYFGSEGYWCQCYALNNALGENNTPEPTSAKSQKGFIHVAYLKKHFMREPISTSVEIEEQVQLQCLPPPGLPIPEVFWLKDGKLINPKTQNNFIISNEGNLILTQARLSDMGNYTCGAQNVASKRLSEPARLTVYVVL